MVGSLLEIKKRIKAPCVTNDPSVSPRSTSCPDPLGIPAAFAFLLVRQRSAINPPTDARLQKTRGKEHVVVSPTFRAIGVNVADRGNLVVRLMVRSMEKKHCLTLSVGHPREVFLVKPWRWHRGLASSTPISGPMHYAMSCFMATACWLFHCWRWCIYRGGPHGLDHSLVHALCRK